MDKEPTEYELSGMTTMDRLATFGVFNDWRNAAEARDLAGMVKALMAAKFDEKSALGIADTVVGNPEGYGY